MSQVRLIGPAGPRRGGLGRGLRKWGAPPGARWPLALALPAQGCGGRSDTSRSRPRRAPREPWPGQMPGESLRAAQPGSEQRRWGRRPGLSLFAAPSLSHKWLLPPLPALRGLQPEDVHFLSPVVAAVGRGRAKVLQKLVSVFRTSTWTQQGPRSRSCLVSFWSCLENEREAVSLPPPPRPLSFFLGAGSERGLR